MKSRLLVAVSVAALTLTACSSNSGDPSDADGSGDGSAKVVDYSPLTGEPLPDGKPNNPVFVVKIENTVNGAPQYGLNRADMVLEELVEGGLTRLAAFFYTAIPSKVGHVRSLRTSDIGIAGPVGGQIVASGGATGAYNEVEGAGITVFSEDAGSPGFSSDPLKSRPYNRLLNLKAVAAKAKAGAIKAPYLPFTSTSDEPSAAPADTATPGSAAEKATTATVRFSGTTSTTWALKKSKWIRTNGHAEVGADFEADTMIVIFCRVGDAGYTDPAGNPVPETVFEGSGDAQIFQGNQVSSVTWSKTALDEPLTFANADGSPFTIDPGKVFIELVPKGEGSVRFAG